MVFGIDQIGFICGCGHSGTTLLATMFSEHPRVYVPLNETNMFLKGPIARRYRLARLLAIARLNGRRIAIEKTPRHVWKLAAIRQAIDSPRFIVMVRDGRDIAASMLRRADGKRDWVKQRYLRDMRAARDAAGQPDVLIVRYEELVTETTETLARACAFLGLEYDASMLDYHKRTKLWFSEKTVKAADPLEHKTYRTWQVNQPVFDGRGRWKETLPQDMVRWFDEDEPRELMRTFGYMNA